MKLPMIAVTVATLGFAAIPAMAHPGPAAAGSHPLGLAAALSPAAGPVVAQQSPAPSEDQGAKTSEDNTSSDEDNED